MLEEFFLLSSKAENAIELVALAYSEDDLEAITESEKDLKSIFREIQLKEIECLFSGEADNNDCFIEIQSGAGGTESNDWSLMLMRMYMRWAEIYHKYKVEIFDKIEGEGGGIKSAILKIHGNKAYGWAKTESGVHRLVRISPFDANAKRHTSFASVAVSPIFNTNTDITILEKDLKVDTFRASGAGGQHVNKTDSAVRIQHLPSGIVVQCQNNRSQHRNKAEALELLKSRLYELDLRKQEEEEAKKRSQRTAIGWGHQIRSYVLHPYQMIKDLRTNYETGNTKAVLDGDLDDFMIANLASRSSNSTSLTD